MLTVQRTSTPGALISTADAKTHLRVDSSADDSLIDALVDSATRWAETYTRRSFVTQTWELYRDSFPAAGSFIVLPFPPVISITSIVYTDTDGNSQTWSSSLYQSDLVGIPARVMPAINETWPTAREVLNAVKITYSAGYGGATAVPADIVAAVKLVLGDLYENRELGIIGTIHAENPSAKMLLDPHAILEGL